MKYAFLLFSLFFSQSLLADEPSVAYECKEGLRTFISEKDEKDRIDTCPQGEELKIDAVSFGANYHMCWLHGTSKSIDGTYKVGDTECSLIFQIDGDILTANFVGQCRYVCGAREWFLSGNYKQKNL
ncbi:MAG: hypothetical protein H7A09_01205 [Oceanospirillaceae bacterium]|nr:hypothetical protein [Oceanospirillaceae bacterium]MCP5350226.1 hypothetical protein [Oceanospirillaceae bacterium]